MPEPFYLTEGFYGQLVPQRFEADVYDCEVIGEIPAMLNGALFRVGGDRYFPTIEGDNVINGDGMISAFYFDNGNVDYRCRFVKTERWLAERKARRPLFGLYRNPYTDDASTQGTDRDNTGNTFAFFHHGKLFAMREDSIPYEIDPVTLDTLGKPAFAADLKSLTMTAHPKVDPITGEWWSYGQFSRKECVGEMSFHVIDRDGKLIREEEFMLPYPGETHDWAVTREHVIFALMPLTVDLERIRAGGDFYAYDPDKPAMLGVMPRAGTTADLRWFEVPNAFMSHFMNAYTEGHQIHIDAPVSNGNAFRFFKDVNGNRTQDVIPWMSRITIDLAANDGNAVTVRPFPGAAGEMPKMDDRFAMSKYRYGYCKGRDGIARLDWETMERKVHPTGKDLGGAQEPVFVPRTPDSPEGDGYILSVVNRWSENRADLVIVDAMNMDGPPVATVRLPFNQPMSFHGGWVPVAAYS